MEIIDFDAFLAVELRVGKIVSTEMFSEEKNPAYILQVDFGPETGVKKSSAQIT